MATTVWGVLLGLAGQVMVVLMVLMAPQSLPGQVALTAEMGVGVTPAKEAQGGQELSYCATDFFAHM
jgi:hypothetical protein